MGQYLDFIGDIHGRTKRDYLARVLGADKAACAIVARRFDRDYWDGDRKHGYGGYSYDGRWRVLAQRLIGHYALKPGSRILDIGCGKGYLLHDFLQVDPSLKIDGIDISNYALGQASLQVRPFLQAGNAIRLPWDSRTFDLVLSINVLHNLRNFELHQALAEIERVARGGKYVVVDSFRNERERVNLMYWQLTCSGFYSPEEWEWLFQQSGYTGDYACIYYE